MEEDFIIQKGVLMPQHFTGNAYYTPLFSQTDKSNYGVGDVIFSPGCRNYWHTHAIGQKLIVLSGKGYYQEKGKPARLLQKGDIVNIPPFVKHWHGAAPDSWFEHIAITDGSTADEVVTWLEPVTDKEYNDATK